MDLDELGPVASSVVVSCSEAIDPKTNPDPPSSMSPGTATQQSHAMDTIPCSTKPDMCSTYDIPDHVTKKDTSTRYMLPTVPSCPGPEALGPGDIMIRPSASSELQELAPQLVKIYTAVTTSGVPNYRGQRIPLPHKLNMQAWESKRHLIPDTGLIDMLSYGFPIGFVGTQPPAQNPPNHSSSTRYPEAVRKYLDKELQFGALIGPLKGQPFTPWSRASPLMTRLKRGSNDRRVIMDLSFPELESVNGGIPPGLLDGAQFKMRLPTPTDLVAIIQRLGRGCALYKADLSRAYRQLRSDPLDWGFLGLKWEKDWYVDVAIPFGLRHGASACQRTSEAISSIVREEEGAETLPYIDDTAGGALQEVANAHYNALIECIGNLGLQAALEKCAPPSTRMVWVGVVFDTVEMSMEIEEGRVEEALAACNQLLRDGFTNLGRLQSLVGKIMHASKCTPAARVFTSRLLDLIAAARNQGMVALTHEARADLAWLAAFLHCFNGKTMMKVTQAQRVVHVDSCLQAGGGICEGVGYYKQAYPDSIMDCGFSINALECFNVLISVRLWVTLWSGLVVLIFVDNWATVCALNSGRASDPLMRAALREIWWLAALNDVEIVVRHKPGAEMDTADTLSRAEVSKIHARKYERFASSATEPQHRVTSTMLSPPLPI